MREEWESLTQELQELGTGHCYLFVHNPSRHGFLRRLVQPEQPKVVTKVNAPHIADVSVPPKVLEQVERAYLQRYFVPRASIEHELSTRRSPDTIQATPGRVRQKEDLISPNHWSRQ